jgi:uncharacterized cupredoxin-like copper-binding protein
VRRNHELLPLVVAGVIVLALAGCSSSNNSGSTGTTSGGEVTATTATSAGPTVVTVVGGEKSSTKYYLTVTPASVKAGPTTITFKNEGTMVHEVVVLKTDTPADQLKVGANHEVSEDTSVGEDSETQPGRSKSTTIDLKPGKYVLVCNIERHYERGMFVAFTVT